MTVQILKCFNDKMFMFLECDVVCYTMCLRNSTPGIKVKVCKKYAIYLMIGALFSSAQKGFENKSAIWFGIFF